MGPPRDGVAPRRESTGNSAWNYVSFQRYSSREDWTLRAPRRLAILLVSLGWAAAAVRATRRRRRPPSFRSPLPIRGRSRGLGEFHHRAGLRRSRHRRHRLERHRRQRRVGDRQQGNTYQLALGRPAAPQTRPSRSTTPRTSPPRPPGPTQSRSTSAPRPTDPDLRILEYGGIDPVTPIDAAIGSSGIGTTSSGSLTTTHANDLLVAANYSRDLRERGAGYTPGS